MTAIPKEVHKKLAIYKKSLLQTVSHNKLILEVSSELELMEKEMEDYFKPLYNAFKHKSKTHVKVPNEFDIKVSYDILNKLEVINQRVDDMIACDERDSEEIDNTISVFEELIEYYQNVSCSFREFTNKYNALIKRAINQQNRGTYQSVMSKVV